MNRIVCYLSSKIVAFVAVPIGSLVCTVPAGMKAACPAVPSVHTTNVSIGWLCGPACW